ncbi:MAG: BACON domain-containing protein [Bacteroidales bacterium]
MIKIKFQTVMLLLFTVAILFTGCKEDTFVSSSVQEIKFTADGGQELLRISASGSWEVNSNQEWCTLSAHTGSGDASIRVSVDPNNDLEGREAYIDIKSGSEKTRVAIVQDGHEYIALSTERTVVANVAGSVKLSIEASAAWEVTKDSEWISSISPSEGSGNSEVTINFSENTQDDNRVAQLTFKIKGTSSQTVFTLEQLSIHGNARQRDSIALEAFAANCLTINREKLWNRSNPINRWAGITTKVVSGDLRVSEINLASLMTSEDGEATPGIVGSHLPSELQFLTELTSLQISSFNLGGEIPSFLGKLTKLTTLNLSSNVFEGTLPAELAQLTNLRVLNISANYLSGDLPNFIGDLTSLTDLNISINNFQRIPDNFARLVNLTKLNMSGLGQIPDLEEVPLRLCKSKVNVKSDSFERDFPVTITYLSKLESLRMHSSNFKGSIPSTISNMQSLGEFVAYNNKLSGSIPASIQYATKIQVLNLSQNQLSGSIPEGLSALSQYLLTLNLSENQLSGELPSDFADLYCTSWNLSDNNLTGNVDAIFNRGWAIEVYLNNNNFSGSVPESLGAAKNIERLHLSNNNFTSLPDGIFDLTSLHDLRVDNNKITQINPNIQYLSRLSILHLHNNEITGEIPSFLGNINRLSNLTLSGNRFIGEVPQSLIALSDKNGAPTAEGSWSPSPLDWSQICPQQDGYGVDYPSGYNPDQGNGELDGEIPSIGV